MNIFRLSIIALSLTLLVACAGGAVVKIPVHWTLDRVTEEERRLAIELVLDELEYPHSAKFGDFWALQGTNGYSSVCGYVDFRNSQGVYVGNTMFSARPYGRPDKYVLMASNKNFKNLFPKICQERIVR